MKRRTLIKNSLLGSGFLAAPKPIRNLFLKNEFTKADFGGNFKWGVATAAYQIEGAVQEDGRGPSIWDTFSHTKKKTHNGDTGDVACDFYHRYPEDIRLIQHLNFDVFRFSLAWPRIIPEGYGKVNPKGLDFYKRVVDKCREFGIEPWITLFHWDLPQALQDKGGWTNREIVNWFADYVDVCTRALGDEVKNWMILNEPMAFVAVGHLLGMHPPGYKSLKHFSAATHHATLCQAEGGRVARANVTGANIGSTFSCSHVEPKNDSKRHVNAARKADVLVNRLFIEPALGMVYPIEDLGILKSLEQHIKPGDEEKMKFDFDFIGLQNYTRIVTRFSLWPPFVWANQVKPHKIEGAEITEMDWEVYPEGIYKVLKRFSAYEGIDKIIVTENGAAFPDKVEGSKVHDERRVQFYKDYLRNVLKAKREGVNIQGYFAWTLMDNFEWAEGYDPRFGLIYVDFETQKRIIKDSGYWFKELLQ